MAQMNRERIAKPLLRLLYRMMKLRWCITRPVIVGVRLILTKDQRVLLVKHSYQQEWYLPGGGVKRGETLEQAARREAIEEVGAQLGDLPLFGIYTSFYEHKTDHIAVFACDDFTLTDTNSYEIERFAFFDFESLPEDVSLGSLRRIQEYANGHSLPVAGAW